MIGYLLGGAMIFIVDTVVTFLSAWFTRDEKEREFCDYVVTGRTASTWRYMYLIVLWAFAWPIITFANIVWISTLVAAILTENESLMRFSYRILG